MGDVVLLSRLQFAANISFHILFPTITIGLSFILLYLRIRFTRTGDRAWEYAYLFWVKVFALTFALGVVSGITMSFQFGTNWPGFMERAGNIAGPLLGYEVLTAFFLEASFLGIMLFGKHRVSNRLHLVSCVVVALGTFLSAFWILSLNSWMHTPAGYTIRDGVFFAADWWQVIFNPSLPYRLAHMVNASLITAAFLVVGVSAWRIRARVDGPGTSRVLQTGIVMAAVLTPLQILLGDAHGLNTLKYQPAKIAAMEAVWKTQHGAPFTVIGLPDEAAKRTRFALEIPHGASLILTHEFDGKVRGLDSFKDHPPVAMEFFSFRVMVGMGVLMVTVAWWALYETWRRERLSPTLLRVLSWMTFSGWVAVLAGWYVTEVGRQPFLVQGLLRVADAAARHAPTTVLSTLIAYLSLYVFLLFSYVGTLRYLASKPARSLTLPHDDDPAVSRGGAH